MKSTGLSALSAIALSFTLSTCTFTREPLRYREEFFRPVTVISQRSHASRLSTENDQLKRQFESVAKTTLMYRDSLAALQHATDSVLTYKKSRIDNVNGLESKSLSPVTSQTDLRHDVAEISFEEKKLSRPLSEIHARPFAGAEKAESLALPSAHASSLQYEYSEGLSLFEKRRYIEALKIFRSVLEKGIEEDIADNCEYWIGECHFARREYDDAVIHFQKVLSIESSNKKDDAYFMLGKMYEQTGSVEKALVAYEDLNERYPNNKHARIAKYRLELLKHARRTVQ